MSDSSEHVVQIIDKATNEVIHSIPAGSSPIRAAKVERGVNINIDPEKYFTVVEIRKRT